MGANRLTGAPRARWSGKRRAPRRRRKEEGGAGSAIGAYRTVRRAHGRVYPIEGGCEGDEAPSGARTGALAGAGYQATAPQSVGDMRARAHPQSHHRQRWADGRCRNEGGGIGH